MRILSVSPQPPSQIPPFAYGPSWIWLTMSLPAKSCSNTGSPTPLMFASTLGLKYHRSMWTSARSRNPCYTELVFEAPAASSMSVMHLLYPQRFSFSRGKICAASYIVHLYRAIPVITHLPSLPRVPTRPPDQTHRVRISDGPTAHQLPGWDLLSTPIVELANLQTFIQI